MNFNMLACAEEIPADIIFFNGKLITMAEEEHVAQAPEALLVQNGKIAKLGTHAAIFELKRPATQMVDLKGATLMPGFISPHTHPEVSAYLHTFVDLSGFSNRTPEEVWNRLRKAVDETPQGEWIYAKGFDPILVPGLEAPHIGALDRIAPHNPVIIIAQSMHSAWANTPAFKKVGVTAKTSVSNPGSYYAVDADGKLTGLIAEIAAMQPFMQAGLEQIDIKANFQGVMRDYGKHGITSIGTAGVIAKDDKPIMMMRWLSAKNPGLFLKFLAMVGKLPEREPTVRNFLYIKADTPELVPEQPERKDDHFQIIGVKLWYDGSPYTGSMYLSQPYKVSRLMQKGLGLPTNNRGISVVAREVFRERLRTYHRRGFQLAIHSQGDKSTHDVFEDMETLLAKSPRKDHRHRLEHCLLVPPDMIVRIKQLGLTPSFHINHLYYYGSALNDQIIGQKRAAVMLPLHTAYKNKLRFSLHADQPMYPEDPLSLIATAVQRKTRDGRLLGEDQSIPVYAALRAMTIDAAWQLGMEKKLGTLEMGKYADFAILDQNPLQIAPGQIRNIKILATYVAGIRTFVSKQP